MYRLKSLLDNSDHTISSRRSLFHALTRRTVASKESTSGFTIIELLIVIIVVGVLVSIVTVAYGGITRRARDSAVQTELRNFGKTVEIYQAQNGQYPTTVQLTNQGGIRVNKNMYLTGGNNNWYYCISTNGSRFAVGATAEGSRQGYRYDSVDGLQSVSSLYGSTTCPGVDGTTGKPYTGSSAPSGCAWNATTGTCNWQSWIAD